jgi:hypothetical protein
VGPDLRLRQRHHDTNRYLYPAARNQAGVPRFAITTSGVGGEQGLNGTAALPLHQWNGCAMSGSPKPGSHVDVSRAWRAGDTVRIAMPFWTRVEKALDDASLQTLFHGPVDLVARDASTEYLKVGLYRDVGLSGDLSPSVHGGRVGDGRSAGQGGRGQGGGTAGADAAHDRSFLRQG